ncbi:MAG TPA: hypothetical protein VHG51_18695 [Longimicrobiaceae bacterium]|nr:hypothetical protein [Longimicrobiaceae bacterium]
MSGDALRRHLAPPEPEPGLCAGCAHVRVVRSGKGSTFYLCEMSRVDPAFPRYPRLPVLRCRGFAPAEAGATGT